MCSALQGTEVPPVCGTRSSMLAGLSCTKGVWYIYDWDTGSSITDPVKIGSYPFCSSFGIFGHKQHVEKHNLKRAKLRLK